MSRFEKANDQNKGQDLDAIMFESINSDYLKRSIQISDQKSFFRKHQEIETRDIYFSQEDSNKETINFDTVYKGMMKNTQFRERKTIQQQNLTEEYLKVKSDNPQWFVNEKINTNEQAKQIQNQTRIPAQLLIKDKIQDMPAGQDELQAEKLQNQRDYMYWLVMIKWVVDFFCTSFINKHKEIANDYFQDINNAQRFSNQIKEYNVESLEKKEEKSSALRIINI